RTGRTDSVITGRPVWQNPARNGGGSSDERCGHSAAAHAGGPGIDAGRLRALRPDHHGAQDRRPRRRDALRPGDLREGGEARLAQWRAPAVDHASAACRARLQPHRAAPARHAMPGLARREGMADPRLAARDNGALSDDASPRIEDIVAFRVPGDCVIKLHVATWHAGPHFVHDECLFFNLENLDTNRRDFEDYKLPNEFRISS